MNEVIKSPYRVKQTPTREMVFNVSIEDFNELRYRLPRYGAIDAVLSNLYHQFISQVKTKIPLAVSTEEATNNEDLFKRAISTLEFSV